MNACRRARLFARCALVALVQLSSALALADNPRVALVNPDAELERAARAALEPWHVDLRIVGGQSPGARVPLTHDLARQIAASEAVSTVVWISEDAGRVALWIYDRAADNVVARPLGAAPPFDAPTAAAVALSVKTLLRHSESAPADERYGARESEPTALIPPRQPVPPTVPDTRPTPRAVPRERPAALSVVDLEVWVALRFQLLRSGSFEPRAGLGVVWWPEHSWAGLALRVLTGPGIRVAEPRFEGHLNATTAGLAAALRRDVLHGLRLSGAAGVLADVTWLEGFVPGEEQALDATLRVVPSLTLELGIDWMPSPALRVGLRGAASWLLRTQRYLVGAETVLELSRATFESALVLALTYPNQK